VERIFIRQVWHNPLNYWRFVANADGDRGRFR
jgi:hypothetical protein